MFFLSLFNPPPATLLVRLTSGSIYFRLNPDGDDGETFRSDAANLEVEYTPMEPVPEPASPIMLGTGLAAIALGPERPILSLGQCASSRLECSLSASCWQ